MVQCSLCEKQSVHKQLCKEHFSKYFEKKVFYCIEKYKLLSETDKIAVAVSGGKDSLVLLTILATRFDVAGIAIDEGIKDYRDKSLESLKKYCTEKDIPLQIIPFTSLTGIDLDEMFRKKPDLRPCSFCGTFRRHLLNAVDGFDVIAVGHNLDDEVQSFLMNLLKNQVFLIARQGPQTGLVKDTAFVPRVKPLYFCTEKEVMTYALIHDLPVDFNECPYAHRSFRAQVRDALNQWESQEKGIKEKLLHRMLILIPKLKKKYAVETAAVLRCKECGAPTTKEVCQSCFLRKQLV